MKKLFAFAVLFLSVVCASAQSPQQRPAQPSDNRPTKSLSAESELQILKAHDAYATASAGTYQAEVQAEKAIASMQAAKQKSDELGAALNKVIDAVKKTEGCVSVEDRGQGPVCVLPAPAPKK